MKEWSEFLEEDSGRGSASRLNMVVGVAVGSIVVLWMAYWDKLTEGIFGVYMLATGGIYGFSKWRESVTDVAQIKADSPNQAPEAVIMPSPLPTNTINVGVKDSEQADVAIKPNKRKR